MNETESGTIYIHEDDIPLDIMPEGMFKDYTEALVEIIQSFEVVAEADIEDDGSILIVFFSDYCPNYMPLSK